MDGISLIVCAYNSKLEDILFTFESILRQKDISFEIIFCDDGSKSIFENEIIKYFQDKKFNNYKLIYNKTNQGTVKNILSGLVYAQYSFTKVIGSGDALYNEFTLKDIVSFMKKNELDYCFSDAVYFYQDTELLTFNVRQPALLTPYDKYDKNYILKNLMIYNDFILGAAIFSRTETLKVDFNLLKDAIVYEEDAIVTASIIKGSKIAHFPHYGVYYEYGSGVSTSKNSKFSMLLYKDKESLFGYINESMPSTLSKKALKIAHILGDTKNAKIKRLLLCPSKLIFKSKVNKANKIEKEKVNYNYYNICKIEARKYGI